MAERWPPIYDAEDLAACITQVVDQAGGQGIWEPLRTRRDPPICQGDVLQVTRGLPLLDDGLEPVVLEPEFEHWLVIGNTCDFSRSEDVAPWTQFVPIQELGDFASVEPGMLANFTGYRLSRRFFLPAWPGAAERLRYADFLAPVAALKAAIPEHARVVARMNRTGWILLHSCLVRFLCRDDGRFD